VSRNKTPVLAVLGDQIDESCVFLTCPGTLHPLSS
jgi:hypothetical protein